MKNEYASYLGIDFSFSLMELKDLKKHNSNNEELLKAIEYVEKKVILAYKSVKNNSQDMPKTYTEDYAIKRAIVGINLTKDLSKFSDKDYNEQAFKMIIDMLYEKNKEMEKGR